MSKINSIKGNIWTNKEGATAENTFIEVANENIKYGLPGDGSGDSFDGINQFNSKDSNIYYGQLVDSNSIVKINANKMRAFFNKYYTEEQLEITMGSNDWYQLFFLRFDIFKKTIFDDNEGFEKKVCIYFENGNLYITGNNHNTFFTITDDGFLPAKEILGSFTDIEIPFNNILSSGEVTVLTKFILGKLDDSLDGEFVDFNEKPIDWIEIV